MYKIQELTSKLYSEGVEKGKEEANKIIADAKAQKKQILEEAEAQSKQLLDAVERKIGQSCNEIVILVFKKHALFK
jgi:V/A-type H+-transporting ATPase subunit E